MYYYPFNVGDYQSHTKHLTLLEDLAYRRMLDECYLHERPLPLCAKAIARQINMREHIDAIELVLEEFFEKTEEGWINARAMFEVQEYQKAQEARVRGGKASAAKRAALANTGQNEDHLKSTSSPDEVELKTTAAKQKQKQNQNQEKKKTLSSSGDDDGVIRISPAEVVTLYHSILPELPRVRVPTEARMKKIRSLARLRPHWGTQEFWESYFGQVRASDFLMGRTPRSDNHASWQCDIDFLLNQSKAVKIIEGAYR